ncbi:uncharacterized protein LOC111633093 [Centruroides sculpturatus]|uniref:uncharacterized protein LOC111633093 n=1 Tax=Centruroides sculpturatus TaxID=218467 RepID=UPI000C6EFACA|nr:uncharacterized protein LOC111633093 [Centruroides sculpturatus]
MARKFSEVRIGAYVIATICLILIFLAFTTPNWLSSDRRAYGAEFVKLGLWETCFRSYASGFDLNKSKYYVGCRWILADEYQKLRKELEPPFFVAVQVFFTFGFVATVTGSILILVLHLCLDRRKDKLVISVIALLMLIAALCCTLSVIIFGAMGNREGWMPDPLHNYLSWSFGLGVVGAFFLYVAAILFYSEWRLLKKREKREDYERPYVFTQTGVKDANC